MVAVDVAVAVLVPGTLHAALVGRGGLQVLAILPAFVTAALAFVEWSATRGR